MAGLGFGGLGGVVGPDLWGAPGVSAGEVDAEGAGGAVGGQDFREAVAKLRNRGGQGAQADDGGHSCEMEGVAGGVDVAFEGGGLFAAEIEERGGEFEAGGSG